MLTGFFTTATPLLLQRLLAGIASAWIFVAGGLLAAQLGAREPAHSGLLLGLYYGGTGLGIVFSALVVPGVALLVQAGLPNAAHAWVWAWWALGGGCALATVVLIARAGVLKTLASDMAGLPKTPTHVSLNTPSKASTKHTSFRWRAFSFALMGYGCFGVGYIGYMTFVIALAAGISAFTIVFAAGQIVGPTMVGWIADGPGGLERGLLLSALALWVGAVLAWWQKPL